MGVTVPAEVYEGLERVRRSGRTNMLDRPAVARLAFENEDYSAALWVEENREQYAEGVFVGFEPTGDEEGERA